MASCPGPAAAPAQQHSNAATALNEKYCLHCEQLPATYGERGCDCCSAAAYQVRSAAHSMAAAAKTGELQCRMLLAQLWQAYLDSSHATVQM